MNFEYQLIFENNSKLEYSFKIDRNDIREEIDLNEFPWVYQKIHKCPNCTLSTVKNCICPAAAEIAFFFRDFRFKKSYDKVKLIVKDDEREYFIDCDLQSALNSLLGLRLATSKCPILSKLKYMAFSHLPVASFEETLKRSVGLYMIKQLFISKNGGIPDFELNELDNLYKELKIVNTYLQKRILTSKQNDASVNAINAFFSLSSLVGYSIKDKLNDIKYIFD
jgi:hypothetical protein